VLLIGTSQSFSQTISSPSRKNVIKVNILPPLLSATGEISYERFLKPNLSVVVGLGTNFRADQSDFMLAEYADLQFLNTDIQNRYLLAEVRHYINFCECKPPHGFYAGGFMRYNKTDYSANPQFEAGIVDLETQLNIDYSALNFGALVGYQINVKNWIVDFEFGGLGYAPRWISFNANSTLSSDELNKLSDALGGNFSLGGNYKDIELNSSDVEFNFWTWTFRYAVSIGYNF